MSVWDDFKNWLNQPFSADMPASHWVMFVGLLLLCLMLWGFVLGHIRQAAE